LDLPEGLDSATDLYGSDTPFLPYGYDFQNQESLLFLNKSIESEILNVISGYGEINEDDFHTDNENSLNKNNSHSKEHSLNNISNVGKILDRIVKKIEEIAYNKNDAAAENADKKDYELINQYMDVFWQLIRLQDDLMAYAAFGRSEELRRFNDLLFYANTIY
jgi:hypothetical protein